MTKSNNEWVPEIGQRIGFKGSNDEAICLGVKGYHAWVEYDNGHQSTPLIINLRPIKTEAEKRRESQIDELHKKIMFHGELCWTRDIAETVIEEGYLKPKPLTEDAAEKLWTIAKNGYPAGQQFAILAEQVNAYIRGEG